MTTSVRRRPDLRSRATALALITGLHAGAIGGLLALRVREAPVVPSAPAIQVVLVDGEQEPAPVAAVAAPMPVAVPVLLPSLPAIELPDSAPPAPAAITATHSAVPAEPAAAAAAPEPARVEGSAPVVVANVDYLQPPVPRYPRQAKRARQQGTAWVRVLIDADGQPAEVLLERSSGYGELDEAALAAVREARFRPYRENGRARAARAVIPIEFSLTLRTAGTGAAGH